MNRSKTNDLASLWTGLRQIIWHINDDRCQADASRRKNIMKTGCFDRSLVGKKTLI